MGPQHHPPSPPCDRMDEFNTLPAGWIPGPDGPVPVSRDPALHDVFAHLVTLTPEQRLQPLRKWVHRVVPARGGPARDLAAAIMGYLAKSWDEGLGPCTSDEATCYEVGLRYTDIPPPVLQRLTAPPGWLPALMETFSGGLVTCTPSLYEPMTYLARLDLHALVACCLH